MFTDKGGDINSLLCGPKFAVTSLLCLTGPRATLPHGKFAIANFDSLFCETRRVRWP